MQSRLLRVFVLQLALISVVTVLGIFAASLVAERLLVKRALEGEAKYFWSQRALNAEFALPNTLNLQSWLLKPGHHSTVPQVFLALPPGQHRVDFNGGNRIVFVSEQETEKLYLLFQDEAVSNLGFYFGVLPLSLVLLIMYSLAFLAYWLSKRAVSPLASLADFIERFDFNARDVSELDLDELPGPRDSETLVLAQALEHFVERTKDSIERERNFTRYASHELRTPLAVIRGSLDNLELQPLEGAAARAVSRIRRSSEHMLQLISSLMLLARDKSPADVNEPVDITQLCEEIVDGLDSVGSSDKVELRIDKLASLSVMAPSGPLRIVLSNLIENALRYTRQGHVTVRIQPDSVDIVDTGPGVSELDKRRIFEPFYRVAGNSTGIPALTGSKADQNCRYKRNEESVGGFGLGLAIVEHICSNYGWSISLSSTPGSGSCFTVRFSQAA